MAGPASLVKKNIRQVSGLLKSNREDVLSNLQFTLTALRDILEQDERRFYTKLGCQGTTTEQCLQEVQEKIDALNESGILELYTKGAEIAKDISPFMHQNLTATPVIAELNKSLSKELKHTDKTDEDLTRAILGQFTKEIQDANTGKKGTALSFLGGRFGKDFAESTYTNLRFVIEDGRITGISMKNPEGGTKPISQYMYHKLYYASGRLRGVQLDLGSFDAKAKKELKDNIKNILWDYVTDPLIYDIMVTYIDSYVLTQNAEIFVNREMKVIQGFLGEIATYTIMTFLYGEKGYSATGLIRDAQSGHEIGMDAILADSGFQIKNFTIENDIATFRGGPTRAPTLIQKVFQDEMYIGEAIQNLFALYHYNQPFKGLAKVFFNDPKFNRGMTVDQYQATIYRNLEDNIRKATKFFEYFAYNLLEITGEYSEKIEDYFEPREYMNTFFMITGKLVPASAIINAIMMELEKLPTEHYIESEFHTKNKGGTADTLSASLNDTFKVLRSQRAAGEKYLNVYVNHPNPIPQGDMIEASASTVPMTYEIKVNLARVLESAVRSITI